MFWHTKTGTQVVAKLFGTDLGVLKEKVAQVEEVVAHKAEVSSRSHQSAMEAQIK